MEPENISNGFPLTMTDLALYVTGPGMYSLTSTLQDTNANIVVIKTNKNDPNRLFMSIFLDNLSS